MDPFLDFSGSSGNPPENVSEVLPIAFFLEYRQKFLLRFPEENPENEVLEGTIGGNSERLELMEEFHKILVGKFLKKLNKKLLD